MIQHYTCRGCGDLLHINGRYIKHWCSQYCRVQSSDPLQQHIMSNTGDENFYYLVGLVVTDGCISSPKLGHKSYGCVITQRSTDRCVIDQIQQIFGGKITTEYTKGTLKHNTEMVRWRVSNREFIDYLTDIVGIKRGKTYSIDVAQWFYLLPVNLQAAFIRGCYDGDGSINFYPARASSITSICSASKPFIDMIALFFNNNGVLYTLDQ